MIRVFAIVLAVAGCSVAGGPCRPRAGGDLPDPYCTPGAIETASLATVCAGHAAERRHVTVAAKRATYAAYGEAPGPRKVVDHLIPIELGGSGEVENLWPQSAGRARDKDRVEGWLHRQVCTGTMGLRDAQESIARDWTQYLGAVDR